MSLETLRQLRTGELAKNRSTITEIRLNNCQLTAFPPELYDFAEQLTLLDLSGNQLRDLPDDLDRFTRLTILFCSNNPFEHLPRVLGRCPRLEMIGFKSNQLHHVDDDALPTHTLRWLILTDNQLTALPAALGRCSRLQKLMLAGNRLSRLPDLSACQALELIRLSANQLTTLPDWLPTLPALAWCAIGRNPVTQDAEHTRHASSTLPEIAWPTLQLFEPLGEGASGVTYRAHRLAHIPPEKRATHEKPDRQEALETQEELAVKVFKHTMTSDGAPENELLANQHLGMHPHLPRCLGQLTQHPQDALGLVMQRVPPSLTVLAGPPSLQSCSRDVYGQETVLTPEQCQRLLVGVFEAVAHMHSRGWTHGDVYAHNILWDEKQVILSDMGAASALPEQAAWLTRIECRALGILMAELLARTPQLMPETKTQLDALSKRAQHAKLAQIPDVAEMLAQLNTLDFASA